MRRFKNAWLLLLLLLAVPLAFNALSYINFDSSYGFLQLKKQAIETGWYLPAYYAHVLAAGPGGLIMSLFIGRGPWVLTSFMLQCSLWFICTYLAYYRIREGDIQAHRQWMLRSYALTLAAITLRVYVFFSSWSFDLAQPAAYATIAWLSWVPNLLICEVYLRFKRNRVLVA
jgi:hypothetical protein